MYAREDVINRQEIVTQIITGTLVPSLLIGITTD